MTCCNSVHETKEPTMPYTKGRRKAGNCLIIRHKGRKEGRRRRCEGIRQKHNTNSRRCEPIKIRLKLPSFAGDGFVAVAANINQSIWSVGRSEVVLKARKPQRCLSAVDL